MEIYVVMLGLEFEGDIVQEVFADKIKAQAFVAEKNLKRPKWDGTFFVETWKVR